MNGLHFVLITLKVLIATMGDQTNRRAQVRGGPWERSDM
jgi:hypothetical protein